MMRNKREIRMAKPNPPKLSQHLPELMALEQSGTYTNYGFETGRLEGQLIEQMFGEGHCLSVCNATLGLMVAIKSAMWRSGKTRGYALMPSYTFAATAHAALWCGLTPLFCDVDADTWLASESSEVELLERYKGEVAVIVPCTTFGNPIDMARYDRFHEEYGVDIVVDAAAALGSRDHDGKQFGSGCRWPIVYSMHATKPFAVGEGGIIYSADEAWIKEMRAISSFGFEKPRTTSLPGINAKISEVAALTAYLQLQKFDEVMKHRRTVKRQYESFLPQMTRQVVYGREQAHSYEFVLLPEEIAPLRSRMMQELQERGIGTGCYFSPHLAEQEYFVSNSVSGELPVTEMLSKRVLTLPMYDSMSKDDVLYVAEQVKAVMNQHAPYKVHPVPESLVAKQMFAAGRIG
jgi:dTDP-4-amino-4,6-dideoxygalactose transaminase